jgi:vancomycin resistance protein YoaR
LSTVTDVGPAAGAHAVPRSRRGPVAALALLAMLVVATAVAAVALYAWDAGYEGRVLPGVSVGTVPLAGMDRADAAAALEAAYPYDEGRLILRTPDGDIVIPYDSIGRRVDADAVVDRAMAAGRQGDIASRAVGEIRLALDGLSLEPALLLDEALLAARIENAVYPLRHDPVDATIEMTGKRIVIGRSRTGRDADPAQAVAAATAALADPDAPDEIVVPVATSVVRPAVEDAAVYEARGQAVRMARTITIASKSRAWKINASTIRSWIQFAPAGDGTIAVSLDEAKIPAALAKVTKAVRKPAKSAKYLVARSGRIVGVVASSAGRKLDRSKTVAAIVAELAARAGGSAPAKIKLLTAPVAPKLGTDEAAEKAPVMSLLGSWKTWFPISDRNYYGANIWVPAKLINGTVLKPGQRFDWWDAIWPVTPARGFGPGGIIRSDHTDPTGALGGGMCSSSTTLFNAAMRAGLDMGARYNHRYYISRYPLGLDATVSIIGGRRQSMTFRNDMKHEVFIRGVRTRAGRIGWVQYEIWGIPDGRTVSISRPSVANVREATTRTVYVDTLPKGQKEQVEYPSNGMDVSVTRVVRADGGRLLHRNTWVSRYVLWNGRIEIGR